MKKIFILIIILCSYHSFSEECQVLEKTKNLYAGLNEYKTEGLILGKEMDGSFYLYGKVRVFYVKGSKFDLDVVNFHEGFEWWPYYYYKIRSDFSDTYEIAKGEKKRVVPLRQVLGGTAGMVSSGASTWISSLLFPDKLGSIGIKAVVAAHCRKISGEINFVEVKTRKNEKFVLEIGKNGELLAVESNSDRIEYRRDE